VANSKIFKVVVTISITKTEYGMGRKLKFLKSRQFQKDIMYTIDFYFGVFPAFSPKQSYMLDGRQQCTGVKSMDSSVFLHILPADYRKVV
jgi:hypothetical protein